MPLTPRCRAWLEKDGHPVFGDGRAQLLEAIRRAGSINGGAAMMGMSYRNAWAHLNQMERRLDMKLVERRVGGTRGGGCRLTPAGERLLTAYAEYRKTLDREMVKLWRKMSPRTRR